MTPAVAFPTVTVATRVPGDGLFYFKIGPEEAALRVLELRAICLRTRPPHHWLAWELAKLICAAGVDLDSPQTWVTPTNGVAIPWSAA